MRVIISATVEDAGGHTEQNVRNIVERALGEKPVANENTESLDEAIGESIGSLGVILGELEVTTE